MSEKRKRNHDGQLPESGNDADESVKVLVSHAAFAVAVGTVVPRMLLPMFVVLSRHVKKRIDAVKLHGEKRRVGLVALVALEQAQDALGLRDQALNVIIPDSVHVVWLVTLGLGKPVGPKAR